MEETNSETIFGPVRIIFGKQYLRIVRDGRYPGFEAYRLLADVIGAEMIPFGSPLSASNSDGVIVLLTIFSLFGSIAYGYRTAGVGDIDFMLPTLIAGFCLLIILNKVAFSKPEPGMNCALQIQLRSGETKIVPSSEPDKVRAAVIAINGFLFNGAYSSQVVVENGFFGLTTTVENHTR